MARYVLSVEALRALRGALASLEGPVEIELEPLPPPFTVTRSEPLRPLVAELVAKGLSNAAIAAELNDRGEFGPQGGLWHSSSIKRLRARLEV